MQRKKPVGVGDGFPFLVALLKESMCRVNGFVAGPKLFQVLPALICIPCSHPSEALGLFSSKNFVKIKRAQIWKFKGSTRFHQLELGEWDFSMTTPNLLMKRWASLQSLPRDAETLQDSPTSFLASWGQARNYLLWSGLKLPLSTQPHQPTLPHTSKKHRQVDAPKDLAIIEGAAQLKDCLSCSCMFSR